MNMKNKKGVSMIILLITIIVVIILMSSITLKLGIASGREDLSILVNNISVIEEYIESCNILKEDLPFCGNLSMSDVINLVDTEYISSFDNELAKNGDADTTTFKKVDLSKVGIKKTFTGYGEEGKKGENDIYIYSEKSGTVYYLYGVEYDKNVYFSINDEVTNIVN